MVEWKKLVAVADILYGYPFESSQFSEDSTVMPLIRIRDVKPAKASTYYSGEFNEAYRIRSLKLKVYYLQMTLLIIHMGYVQL